VRAIAVAISSLISSAGSAQTAVWTAIPNPPGTTLDCQVAALSGDGRTVLIFQDLDGAWTWTADAGLRFIGRDWTPVAISYDGGVVTGGLNSMGVAVRWSAETGQMVIFGDGQGRAISRDGNSIAINPPIRWNWDGAVILPFYLYQHDVAGISDDGRTVAYWTRPDEFSPRETRLWFEGQGVQVPTITTGAKATLMTPDSRVLAGSFRVAFPPPSGRVAYFRWTRAGMREIPGISPRAMSEDGWRIIGDPDPPGLYWSVIWDPASGSQDLATKLTAWGATGFESLQGLNVNAISRDGRTIAGIGQDVAGHFQMWMATIPAFCYANCDGSTASPVLNVLDFNCFLNKFTGHDHYANCDNDGSFSVLDFNCFLNKFVQGCP
jgi:hypothetical protein